MEVAEKLNATRRSVQIAMKKLQDAGRIVRIVGKRLGHWQIQGKGPISICNLTQMLTQKARFAGRREDRKGIIDLLILPGKPGEKP